MEVKHIKRTVVAAAAGLAVTALLASPAIAQKKVLLKTPVAFGTHLPGLGTPIKRVAKELKRASGGSIVMKVYEPKKLVAPFEILDAVSTGKINAGYATAGYWAGKIKAAPLFSAVPFGPEAGEYMAWLYYGNGWKLYQEMYDQAGYKVKVLPCAIIAPETSGWYSKEMTADDFKGLRIRFFGLGGKVVGKLGASVALLPGGEIFDNLEKKAIDATEFSMPAIDKLLGFHKILKYNYFPGWHQQATVFELMINKGVWDGMAEQQQAVVENVCKASMADSLAEGEAVQHEALITNVEKNGVKIMQWKKSDLDTFRKAWLEVVAEESKDPFFKKVWDDLSKFRKGYAIWKKNAFLPRK
ncbi:MAG: TRAP transporter substrate-binding protein [bacterium]|nr:TRAP transporter substrate-binding protein [bacterium]